LAENLLGSGSGSRTGSGLFQKSDPDPVKNRPDPQHCIILTNSCIFICVLFVLFCVFSSSFFFLLPAIFFEFKNPKSGIDFRQVKYGTGCLRPETAYSDRVLGACLVPLELYAILLLLLSLGKGGRDKDIKLELTPLLHPLPV
jgi:hypothetical protein